MSMDDLQRIALERLTAGDIKGAEELIRILKRLEKPTSEPPAPKPKRPVCTCLHCGGIWQPRTDHPSFCPKCLSRKWDRPVEKIPTWLQRCERCEFEWESRRFRPAVCPSCKSGKWHIFRGPDDKESPEAKHWYRHYRDRGVSRAQWEAMVESGRVSQEIATEVKA